MTKVCVKKIKIVDDAVNSWCMNDPIEKLSKVGGFDICAMVGAFLGAAGSQNACSD